MIRFVLGFHMLRGSLIDVSDEVAQDRRIDHFYKGSPVGVKPETTGAADAEDTEASKCTEYESSEWNLAPVNLSPHCTR